MRSSFIVFLFLVLANVASAQAKLRCKVIDANGETMVGVMVRLEGDNSKVVFSDLDGNAELVLGAAGKYKVHYTMLGYEELVEDVECTADEVVVRSIVMVEKGLTSGEVVITAKAVRAADAYMERMKQNSAVTLDYISSETFKKTGDQNVVNAIARVSGVSTNGGLITVRGIGDRYVRTMLNGSRIPTLDPLTNNIRLDIFPSSLVDNIVITKTASAELPGDWAGAYISVETKDYPEKLTLNIESQFGYNAQTTFRDFITSERSGTDKFGFDNGLRKREAGALNSPNLNPSTYNEMVALGLGSYYAQMGIHGWNDGNAQAEAYFKLGLVQLGLLGAAQIDNATAYDQARNQYLTQYRPLAFSKINPDGTDYNNGFNNSWNTRFMRAPMNFSQNFSIGNQVTLFGKPLGYIIGFRYGSNYRYDPEGISQRVGDATLGYPFDRQDYAQISRETNSWNALINLNYKFNDHHKASVLFMPNFLGANDVAAYSGIPFNVPNEEIQASRLIFYEQRKQLVYQWSSEHFFPVSEIRVNTSASYTDGASVAPDFKATEYLFVVDDGKIESYQFSPTAGDGIRRYFRYLDENIFDARVNAERPMRFGQSDVTGRVKFGASYLSNYRKIDNDEYRVMLGNNPFLAPLLNGDLDQYLSAEHFIMQNGRTDYYYSDFYFDRNHSFGHSNVFGTYAQFNLDLTKRIRLFTGARVEHTDIFTDVDKYYAEGYARNDPRRENVGGFPFVNAAELNQWHFLPNLSVIYSLQSEKAEKTNLRLNVSRSLARPSIRELSDAAIFDNEFRTLIYGNSDLKIVSITNYDLRWETYRKSGDNFSVSLFYKDFRDHIEMGFGSTGITWENIERSSVTGLELEGKKQVTKEFEIRANVTLVRSVAQFIRRDFQVVDGLKEFTVIDTINRPMYGQAPYLVNLIASYNIEKWGMVATASFNVQGPRLVIAGAVRGRPDVYELPRNLLDVKVSKNLGKHFVASINIRDIFNSPVRRSYDLPKGWVDFDRFRYGTNYMFTLTYKL